METFKGATLEKYGEINITLKDYDLRKPSENEVLVKVMSSTILPSDIGLFYGRYGKSLPKLPRIMGGEASGIIVEVGEGTDKSLIGRHVAIAVSSAYDNDGVWAQFCYVSKEYLFVFEKNLDFDKICGAFVNPFTACGFLDTVLKSGKKSVAQNGASTALGRMFLKLCVSQGIEIINVVRKESSIKELSELGGKHFVSTSDEGWETKLKDLCEELDVTILFDCCAGEMTGKCLSAIKAGGTVYNYGLLEQKQPSGFSSKDFIFLNKSVKGWWMPNFLTQTDPKELIKYRNQIINDYDHNEGKIFSTEYKESFSLNDINKAIQVYTTSSGKILIKPWI